MGIVEARKYIPTYRCFRYKGCEGGIMTNRKREQLGWAAAIGICCFGIWAGIALSQVHDMPVYKGRSVLAEASVAEQVDHAGCADYGDGQGRSHLGTESSPRHQSR